MAKEGIQFREKVRVDGNNCQFACKEVAAFTTELWFAILPKKD